MQPRKIILVATMFAAILAGCAPQNAEPDADRRPAAESVSDPEIRRALQAIEADPENAGRYVALAGAYIHRARSDGDFRLNTSAEAAVDRALSIAPGDPSALKLKASLFLTFHRFEEALELARRLERELPADAFVQGVLTDANAELGNYPDAVRAAQSMVDLKPNSASYARVAHIRSLHGDSAGAVEMYRLAARTADPAEKEAQSWCLVQLGDEYWRSGRNAEAESAYDEALQNLPDYFLAVAGKARSRASAGDLETAESLLGPLNARTPNVDNIILLGDVLTLLGRATEASRHYALAEALGSGAENDRKRLAVLWADHDRRIDEALSIVRNESSRRRDIHTLDALAWTLCRAGLLSDAKSAAAEAMNLKTGDARIIYHAGMIERDLGNVAEAKRLLEAALRKNPAFDLLQAENARRVLAEIRLERRIR